MTRLTIICHAPTSAVHASRFADDEAIDDPCSISDSLGPPIKAARWLSGPERRATATAAALAADRDVTVDQDLREWDSGRWRGQDFSDLHRCEPENLAAWLSDPTAAPHGGESLCDLLARIGLWLDRQVRESKTAAVSHPAVLRAAVVQALAVEPAAFWRIDAQPLSRVQLSHDGRRWTLQTLVGPRDPG